LSAKVALSIPFNNSYNTLPASLYAASLPLPVAKPAMIAFNHELAVDLGVNSAACSEQQLTQVFSGNQLPDGAQPLALAYSGHQFGHLNPGLGDGRALLLGEVLDNLGQRRDIQLKGSGRTPFSRGGDGRSPLGPVIREYVMCEAMHALGVPTTRALAAVSSGEWVYRQQREPGAVFTRVAASHVRVGTFQFAALQKDTDLLRRLADYVIERHFQAESVHWSGADVVAKPNERYLALFAAIVQRQAKLIAQWMQLGFIHGVMNTDNMTISGETIDYGPCAFIDRFDPAKVFSSIDRDGRYGWQNQPAIGQWNLARLAEALLPVFGDHREAAIKELSDILERYPSQYETYWLGYMRSKLGLITDHEEDASLVDSLLTALHQGGVDYTLFFRRLCDCAANPADSRSLSFKAVEALFSKSVLWHQWAPRWQQRLSFEADVDPAITQRMRNVNPAFIPRNHRVAEVIRAAEQEQNYEPFSVLCKVLSQPFADQPDHAHYQQPPQDHEQVLRTFCGT